MKLALIAALGLFALGCGSVSDTKPPAATPEAACDGTPGKVRLLLWNASGKAVCNGQVKMTLQNGQKAVNAVASLGEKDGKAICGVVLGKPGSASIEAQGFSAAKATWSQPGACETNDVNVTLN